MLDQRNEEVMALSKQYFLAKDYNRIIPPNQESQNKPDDPLEIMLEINNLGILEVDEFKFTVTMQMHLGIHWQDQRIIVSGTVDPTYWTPLDLKVMKNLWIPDLDIYNVKQIISFEALRDLAGKKYRVFV